jgi:large subunit ribosomal protein L13
MTVQTTQRKTHELDASGQSVGRLATRIAMILRGKHTAHFEPHKDTGDAVTVINASKLKFTGRKLVQKDFLHHSMYPGGLKRTPMKKVFEQNPGKVIEHAVYGMLPKNSLRKEMMKRLTIHA